MGSGIIALLLAAGGAAFGYAKLGSRIGYGNNQSVWLAVAAIFVAIFLVVFILLKTLVQL